MKDDLSPREDQILKLIISEHTTSEIDPDTLSKQRNRKNAPQTPFRKTQSPQCSRSGAEGFRI